MGIAGQTGPYLADLLNKNNYKVYGTVSKTSKYKELINLGVNAEVEYLEDISSQYSLQNVLNHIKPNLIINLAAMSSVLACEQNYSKAWAINALAPNAILDWLTRPLNNNSVFCQVGSINVYEGGTNTLYVDESYVLKPKSIYAQTKAYAIEQVRLYRKVHGIKAINAILGPNESPRRPPQFFSSKVITYLSNYKKTGLIEKPLYVGDLDIIRTWGHSYDYMNAVVKILNSKRYEDFIVSSEAIASTKDFIEQVCYCLGIKLKWSEWFGYDQTTGKVIIEQSRSLFRLDQARILTANNTKIKELDWRPVYDFHQIIQEMVNTSMGT